MTRDFDLYPDDDNGNVLWQMHEDGSEMSEFFDIEFSIAFKEKAKAEQCALHLLHLEQKVSLFSEDELTETEWTVTIHVHMEPQYTDIVDLEEWFIGIAEKFQGEYDGWGCLSYVYDDEDWDIDDLEEIDIK